MGFACCKVVIRHFQFVVYVYLWLQGYNDQIYNVNVHIQTNISSTYLLDANLINIYVQEPVILSVIKKKVEYSAYCREQGLGYATHREF